MILRINIGAFVLTDAVRDAVNELGADRAFLRSSVNVTEGGMAAALDFLSQRSTPELLIIETTADRHQCGLVRVGLRYNRRRRAKARIQSLPLASLQGRRP